MKLSNFYQLVLDCSECSSPEEIGNVMQSCVKAIFVNFVQDDCMPKKVTDKNRAGVARMVKDAQVHTKAKTYLLLHDFVPSAENMQQIEELMQGNGARCHGLVVSINQLWFWQRYKKSDLEAKLSVIDKELSLAEEVMFLWCCYSKAQMGKVEDFKALLHQAAEVMIVKLVEERENRYGFRL